MDQHDLIHGGIWYLSVSELWALWVISQEDIHFQQREFQWSLSYVCLESNWSDTTNLTELIILICKKVQDAVTQCVKKSEYP